MARGVLRIFPPPLLGCVLGPVVSGCSGGCFRCAVGCAGDLALLLERVRRRLARESDLERVRLLLLLERVRRRSRLCLACLELRRLRLFFLGGGVRLRLK